MAEEQKKTELKFDVNPAEKKNPLFDFLHKISLEKAGCKKEVFTLHGENSVDEAVIALSEKKVLSMPVVEKEGSDKLIGAVDMLDVMAYVHKVAPTFADLEDDALSSLSVAGRAIALMEVRKIIDESGKDALMPLAAETPLTTAVELFATGIHRTLLTEGDNPTPIGLCSQSDVARLLSEYIGFGKLKNMGEITLDKLGLGLAKPVCIKSSHSVLYILQHMMKEGVSCVALTNGESGRLEANFSASDLRGLYRTKFPAFRLAASKFLEKKAHDVSLTPVVVNSDSTLAQLLAAISENNLHHVWVVDGDFKPAGVITLTDVMKAIRDYEFYKQ
jgi:CBS domain-containing protein